MALDFGSVPPGQWAAAVEHGVAGSPAPLTGASNEDMYANPHPSGRGAEEFTAYLAGLNLDSYNAHVAKVGQTDPTNASFTDEATENDCVAGFRPAVYSKMCRSLKPLLEQAARSRGLAYRLTLDADFDKWVYTWSNGRGSQHAGWGPHHAEVRFVDACVTRGVPYSGVNNIYSLSAHGSTGLAQSTTASFLGEATHKEVYRILAGPQLRDRFTSAVKEQHRQLRVPVVARMAQAIINNLGAKMWTVYDTGQPSVYTVPGIIYGTKLPRCIPDQILYKDQADGGRLWAVCEYKTRYSESHNASTIRKNNAMMAAQCIWQAVAFKACTGHAHVCAKAVEVSVRSNVIAQSRTRGISWSCSAEELLPWFAWVLLATLSQENEIVTSPLTFLLTSNATFAFGSRTSADKDHSEALLLSLITGVRYSDTLLAARLLQTTVVLMPANNPIDLNSCNRYTIESILEHRTNADGETEYSVKWEGYPEPTWEPSDNIKDMAIFIAYTNDNSVH